MEKAKKFILTGICRTGLLKTVIVSFYENSTTSMSAKIQFVYPLAACKKPPECSFEAGRRKNLYRRWQRAGKSLPAYGVFEHRMRGSARWCKGEAFSALRRHPENHRIRFTLSHNMPAFFRHGIWASLSYACPYRLWGKKRDKKRSRRTGRLHIRAALSELNQNLVFDE